MNRKNKRNRKKHLIKLESALLYLNFNANDIKKVLSKIDISEDLSADFEKATELLNKLNE